MTAILRSCAMLSCLIAGLAAVELPQLPANAKWVLHADGQRLMQGETGRWINDLCNTPRIAATLKVVEAVSGFEPRRDLVSLTACGPDRDERKALAVLRGSFDAERLVVLLQTNPTYTASNYGDFTIHRWQDDDSDKTQWATLAADDTIVFCGSEAVLKASLDVYAERAPALEPTTVFGALPDDEHTFFVGLASDLKDSLDELPPNAAILRQIDGLVLAFAEIEGTLQLEATSTVEEESSATHLENMLRGLISLAAINPQVNDKPVLRTALKSATVQRQGSRLILRCEVPVAQLRTIVQQLQGSN